MSTRRRKPTLRSNPSRMTVIASLPISDAMLLEQMGEGPRNESLKKAIERLASMQRAEGIPAREENIRIRVLTLLSDYVRASFDNAPDAVRWLAEQDLKLVAWTSCACAREALRFLPEGELRPLQAIEAAEGWVEGRVRIRTLGKALDNVFLSQSIDDSAETISAKRAAYYASKTAYHAAKKIDSMRPRVYYASEAAIQSVANAAYTDYDDDGFYEELRRLVDVIADAILTFPG